MPSRKGETGRHSPLEPRQEERISHHRSRRHDKERERSRSPQDRLISKTSQDYERDDKDESGKERHRRERERTDRRQREEGQGEERRGREGERGDRRRKLEGEREDQTHREKGEARQKEEKERERNREWRDRQREERGKREWRQREEGERSDERQRRERRGEGTRGEREVGRQRNRHRDGEEERQEVEMEHNTESSVDQTTKRDEERKKKRELRMAEDEEAKNYEFGGSRGQSKNKEDSEKEEPNFELSGKLTAETNTYKGVVIKYSEPAEARQPTTRWRLYQFKGEEVLPTLYVHRQSAYLIGRDRHVVDLPVDHPSCSSQHAVLQYRLVNFEKKDGSTGKRVRPYLIDLESTNGTYINNQRIESARYWELKEKDMIKFGFSSREYILLHENSQDMDAVG